MELAEQLGAILRALQITAIEYSLNGGGDSGETAIESVTYRDGTTAAELPEIPVQFTDLGTIMFLPRLLEGIVAEAPEGDWVNNEGGYGTVYVRPFEDEHDLAIECNITFREDGDYGDDDDDEDDFVNDEPADGDETPDEQAFTALPIVESGEVAP